MYKINVSSLKIASMSDIHVAFLQRKFSSNFFFISAIMLPLFLSFYRFFRKGARCSETKLGFGYSSKALMAFSYVFSLRFSSFFVLKDILLLRTYCRLNWSCLDIFETSTSV